MTVRNVGQELRKRVSAKTKVQELTHGRLIEVTEEEQKEGELH